MSVELAQILFIPRWAGEVSVLLSHTAIAASEVFIKMPSTGSGKNCLKGGHLKSLPSYTMSLYMSLTENGKTDSALSN